MRRTASFCCRCHVSGRVFAGSARDVRRVQPECRPAHPERRNDHRDSAHKHEHGRHGEQRMRNDADRHQQAGERKPGNRARLVSWNRKFHQQVAGGDVDQRKKRAVHVREPNLEMNTRRVFRDPFLLFGRQIVHVTEDETRRHEQSEEQVTSCDVILAFHAYLLDELAWKLKILVSDISSSPTWARTKTPDWQPAGMTAMGRKPTLPTARLAQYGTFTDYRFRALGKGESGF